MYCIYTYIPETNPVPRGYTVSANLSIHSLVLISFVPALVLLLFFYVSTFRRMFAVPKIAVFCRSQTSWCPGMLLTYFLNDFEILLFAPFITAITVVFTFHIRCISIVRSLYFKIFSASYSITFLSPEIATSISVHFLCSVSRIIKSGLFLGMALSVCTCWFHSMVTLLFFIFKHDGGKIHKVRSECDVVPSDLY